MSEPTETVLLPCCGSLDGHSPPTGVHTFNENGLALIEMHLGDVEHAPWAAPAG